MCLVKNLLAPLPRKQNTSGRDKDWPEKSSELLNVQLFGSSEGHTPYSYPIKRQWHTLKI